jgi:hypothetical protein
VATQFAKRLSWLRQIRLAAAIGAKPGAMDARGAAVKIGHAGNERRQGLGLDAALGAVIAVGQEAEGWKIEIGIDAAAPSEAPSLSLFSSTHGLHKACPFLLRK